jgi:L-2-hydroxyglutarate oxidase LhgO
MSYRLSVGFLFLPRRIHSNISFISKELTLSTKKILKAKIIFITAGLQKRKISQKSLISPKNRREHTFPQNLKQNNLTFH